MQFEPQPQHHWLKQLIGNWTFEMEALSGPDRPPEHQTGTQTVRALGEAWIQSEIISEVPNADAITNMLTLGYDPQKQKFVGTFVSSCMASLWIYEGDLDAAEKVLTLATTGPSMTGKGLVPYQDVIEIVDQDHHSLTSHMQGEDGNWVRFMEMKFRRVQ